MRIRLVTEAMSRGAGAVVERGGDPDRPAGRGQPGHAAGLVQAGRDRRRSTAGDDDERRRADQGAGAGGPRAEAGQRDPAGGVLVLRAGARPATAVVVAFIDDHRDRFGVEPICRVLTEHEVKIAPSTLLRARRPGRRSARAIRDERCAGRDPAGHPRPGARPRPVRGAQGVAASCAATAPAARRLGPVPRCQVERLMRADGLRGVRRGRAFVTTRRDDRARGRRTWSTGTSPPPRRTSCGWSTSPTCRPGRGWRSPRSSPTCSPGGSSAGAPPASMPTELPLDALEMALWTRARSRRATLDRADPSQRRRRAVHLDPLHAAAGRRRRRRLDRHRRRLATTTRWPRA